MFFSVWIALIGCGDDPITGRVVNANDEGINGVDVRVMDSACSAKTDSDGNYEMKCKPGQWTLNFRKSGFVPSQVVFDAADKKLNQVPVQNMVAIPEDSGLFIKKSGDYQALPDAFLIRSMESRDGKLERHYCLQKTTQEPMILNPNLKLYDHNSPPWRLFALNGDRCAYSDTRSASGRWSVGYRNKPEIQVTALGANFSLANTKLTPGHYFIAHWDGFFMATETDGSEYRGHWFQVDG